MKKIIRFLSFIKKLSIEFFAKWKNYGFLLAWYNLIWWLCFYVRPPFTLKISTRAILGKTRWLDKYFMKNYGDIIEYFRYLPVEQNNDEIKSSYTIWVFWGQGEENMPPLVKACYRQLTHYNDNVILLSNHNIDKYIIIPSKIKERVSRREISWAYFSDIIRNALLAKYGGLWLDATAWVSGSIPMNELKEFDIFSPTGDEKLSPKSPIFWSGFEWHWSGWCLWARKSNELLFSFVREMLINIALREKEIPDYVTIDYLIYFACRNFTSVSRKMKQMETKYCYNRHRLASMMNDSFDINKYTELIKDDFVFKLSFRSPWKKYTAEGKQTFYGYILSKYN